MKQWTRPVVVLGGGVALAVYVALDSVLGDLIDVLHDGIGGVPGQLAVLWSRSLVGDGLFVTGTIAAVVVGLTSKRTLAILYATLITWITYAVAATATYPVPTFGEGSTGRTGPENFGYMLVGTPVLGIFGLVFTALTLLVGRRYVAHVRALAGWQAL
jgi:hypothetical protein